MEFPAVLGVLLRVFRARGFDTPLALNRQKGPAPPSTGGVSKSVSQPTPTPDFLSEDFCLQPGLEWQFLLRRTLSGQKRLPLQIPGHFFPY